jgi:hypothetical protein
MASHRSRVVQLRAGVDRNKAVNRRTVVARMPRGGPVDFSWLFACHYNAIRKTCLAISDPGLAIFAIERKTGRMHGSLCLKARPETISSAVIGRHGQADLYLDGDPGLALRHLLVVIEKLSSYDSGEIRFRLMDLRTGQGFVDEKSRRLESLVAEGPCFVSCGDYALLLLVTGDPTDFPEDPFNAWSFIPERVFLEEKEVRPVSNPPAALRRSGSTLVTSLPGPGFARMGQTRGEVLGRLLIYNNAGRLALTIGEESARRGILFGRYDRCNKDALTIFAEQGISRVHVLLQMIGERLYLIDTASTYGIYRELRGIAPQLVRQIRSDLTFAVGTGCQNLEPEVERVRCVELEQDQEIIMGLEFAAFRWENAV